MKTEKNIHQFDLREFRKRTLPWMLVLMSPSLAVDAVVIFRVLTLHPVVLSSSGVINLLDIIVMLLINAVLLKTYAIVIYLVLRFMYKNSTIIVHQNMIVYRKRRMLTSGDEYHRIRFTEYYLKDISHINISKSGAVTVSGTFRILHDLWNGETEEALKKQVTIPAYFTNMSELIDKLNKLLI